MNRIKRAARDMGKCVPDLNTYWFVQRTLDVGRTYGLSIDHREANAADEILKECEWTDMIAPDCNV